jgi:hypothetical protein
MRAIINGLRYDTEKAVALGRYDSPHYQSDFHNWSATLYKSPRADRYFLAGEGGPMSQFARPAYGGGWGSGSKIMPLTRDEAREWAEQYLDTDAIEAAFAKDIQDA